jgi:hypothetical protein
MTLGAVHDSPTTAQRVPLQVPGEWAIWNIGQKLREQIVIIGEYRLAGQSKILRGTPNCLPIWPDTHPPSVTLCLAGMGAPGGTCRPTLCVPKFAALPWSLAILTWAPIWPPVPSVVLHLVSSPCPPPYTVFSRTPSWVPSFAIT